MIRIPLPTPPPINPSYQPEASITTVPAAHSIDYILSILERDGGMILKDLVSPDELAAIDEELEPWSNKPRRRLENKKVNSDAFASIPAQTILVPDLVGKSQTVAQICEHPVLEALPQRILREEFTLMRVGFAEPNTIDPLLSLGFSTIQIEMSAGSALIFLAFAYHGGAHNSVPDSVRTMHGLFFSRGHLRTEENQFLAIPWSKVGGMSPKMFEILGYKKPTAALGIVDNMSPDEDVNGIWERGMQ